MTREETINNKYFDWMCHFVCDEHQKSSYYKLLQRLHHTNFYFLMEMDGNRAEDGMDLRYRFGYETNQDSRIVALYLDHRPCSVLEMMVALAIRCEEHIMDDPDVGNRTGQWFWSMMKSLGLESMNDIHFDQRYVDDTIRRFLNREYKRDGEGGLFTLEHTKYDLRSVEIWYQMCWYLDRIV